MTVRRKAKALRKAAERAMAELEAAQAENQEQLGERRRKLTNAFHRAVNHLEHYEMDAIEAVIFTAIGRSMVA